MELSSASMHFWLDLRQSHSIKLVQILSQSIIEILQVLFDSVSTFSYEYSYVASHLSMPRDSLDVPVTASTLIRDSIIVYMVYRFCVVSFNDFDIVVDIFLRDKVNLRPFLVWIGCPRITLSWVVMPKLLL